MYFGYRVGITLTSLVLMAAVHAPAKLPLCPAPTMYSQRALRAMRTLLQLRLLELRKERLEQVADAVERRLSIDELLAQIDPPVPKRRRAPRCRFEE